MSNAKCREIISMIEKTAAQLESFPDLRSQANAILEQASRADAYRGVCNAMGKHVFGNYGQIQKKELEEYWSKRDDIAYAHNSVGYVGRECVYNHYVNASESEKARRRSIIRDTRNEDVPDDIGPGHKAMNMLMSPYVEISADGNSAKGVWMVYSYTTDLNEDGKTESSTVLSRYTGEFVLEDGEWKILRRCDYVEGILKMKPAGGPPPGGPPPGGDPSSSADQMRQEGIKMLTQMDSKWSQSNPEPHIPQPYKTMCSEISYCQVAFDPEKE